MCLRPCRGHPRGPNRSQCLRPQCSIRHGHWRLGLPPRQRPYPCAQRGRRLQCSLRSRSRRRRTYRSRLEPHPRWRPIRPRHLTRWPRSARRPPRRCRRRLRPRRRPHPHRRRRCQPPVACRGFRHLAAGPPRLIPVRSPAFAGMPPTHGTACRASHRMAAVSPLRSERRQFRRSTTRPASSCRMWTTWRGPRLAPGRSRRPTDRRLTRRSRIRRTRQHSRTR